MLLKEILNDDSLIQEWNAVFGDRFINVNAFMVFLRDFVKMLFDLNNVIIIGPYNKCSIGYNELNIQRFS